MDLSWNTLFNLNSPDEAQTPMLSYQELQEDLSLWSNAQFSLENPTSTVASSPTAPVKPSRPHQLQQQQQQEIDGAPAVAPQTLSETTKGDPHQHHSLLTPSTQASVNGSGGQNTLSQQQQQQAQLSLAAAVAAMGQPNYIFPLLAPALANIQQVQSHHNDLPSQTERKQQQHRAILPAGPLPNGTALTPISTADIASGKTTTMSSPAISGKKPSRSNGKSLGKGTNESKSPEEEDRRRAAEEDKRRRNTAASARFRVKKKLKEQALEATAREMTVRCTELEKQLKEAQVEIKWLRSLVVERDPDALSTLGCPCHHPNGLDDLDTVSTGEKRPADKPESLSRNDDDDASLSLGKRVRF